MTTDYQDDEKSSLFLLHCIDLETTKNSRHYFNTNMLELSPAGATALVSGRKVGLTRCFKECEWEYKFMRLPLLPDAIIFAKGFAEHTRWKRIHLSAVVNLQKRERKEGTERIKENEEESSTGLFLEPLGEHKQK